MVLDIPGIEGGLFPHSNRFDQGLGRVRPGQGTFVVANDGSGDFSSIQEAHDALPSGGGIILVKEGTYESSRITISKDNVTIKGSGHSTIIKLVAADTHLFVVASNTDYCVVEDLQLDGTNASGYTFLFSANTTRSRISGCWFSNWTPVGCQVWSGATFIIIENCIFETENTAVNNFAILINASSYITVRGNLVLGGTNLYGVQIFTGTVRYVTIVDNFIADSAFPITVIGTNGITERVIISNNTFITCTYGVYLDTSDKNIISGNTINSATVGVYCVRTNDYNCISSNLISNSTFGVFLTGSASVQNTIIIGNSMDGNTTDISDGGTNTQIGHNIY